MLKAFWQIFYNALWHLVLPVWIAFHIFYGRKGQKAFQERLGLYPFACWKKKPVIWFHGSSLGEIVSLWPFMQALQKEFSHTQILSTQTPRGRCIAEQKCQVDALFYLPLDISYIVRRSLKRLKPDLLVVFETEIWPNLFWECKKQNIPLVVISGRISPRSFPKYKKARLFFQSVLDSPYLLMQSQEDKERILQIGANPEHVKICGDIKLDGISTSLSEQAQNRCDTLFSLQGPILLAGSTHHAEEATLIKVYLALKEKYHNLQLVLAPRHLNRILEIEQLLKKQNREYSLRSTLPSERQKDIVILDSYGELSQLYYKAYCVFVGGTLVPIGGHNLMEPAGLGKPVLFGPYIGNCKKQAQLLLEKKAGYKISSDKELQEKLDFLLSHQREAEEMGQKGKSVILHNQGAMQKCLQEIKNILRIE